MAELRPAQPKTLAERLAELFYDDQTISDYNIRQIREKERMAQQRAAFEEAGGGLDAPIPGGNPEVPTGADALIGALMSMGGLPPNIARSGVSIPTRVLNPFPKKPVFYHGSDLAGMKAIEKSGALGAHPSGESTWLTTDRAQAESWAKRKGGKIFEVRGEDIPPEILEQWKSEDVVLTLPGWVKNLRVPIVRR